MSRLPPVDMTGKARNLAAFIYIYIVRSYISNPFLMEV